MNRSRAAVFCGVVLGLLLFARPSPVAVPDFATVRAAYRPSDRAILDRRGEVIHEIRVDRTIRRLAWTPLEEVSPALVDAVLRSEDRRFHEHGGVDWRAVVGALAASARGQPLRGASTITMQLATAIFRREHGSRTFGEKLRQMRAARAIEAGWTKSDILEAYLNLVSFRGELQGVAAASNGLFGKSPHGIDVAEAAVLASLLRSPNAAGDVVLRRARVLAPAEGGIEAAVARLDGANPLARMALVPHVAERLRQRFDAGTDVVQTTLDARTQRLAADTLHAQLLALRDRRASDGAVLVADNATGDVLAYVGSSAELSSARYVDGVQAPRQAGSALKPFLYALAFDERLLTPASLLDDTPLEVASATGVYRPENYDRRFRGLVSVRTALAGSLNVPAVRALLVVGVEPFAAKLRELGFARVVENGDYYGPALALGSVEVSLWQLVDGYRALANGGEWTPLRLVSQGDSVPHRRVYSSEAAFLAASVLSDRASRSTTFGLESPLATTFWSAVKTGTSKDMRDNWCVGFSRRYTVGVWVGNFSGEPMQDVTGVSGAAPAWREILSSLEHDAEGSPPPPPGGVERVGGEWFVAGTELATEAKRELASYPRIVSPASGAILARDPDIPGERQRVVFESENAEAGLRWRLDGKDLGDASKLRMWDPEPGRHELALVGRSQVAVDRVRFVVRPGGATITSR